MPSQDTTEVEAAVLELKEAGNKAFMEHDFTKAIELFTQGLEIDESYHILYSNRCACYCQLQQYEAALEDAEMVVALKPDWAKGYQRHGLCLYALKRYEDALEAFERERELNPAKNEDDVNRARAAIALDRVRELRQCIRDGNNDRVGELLSAGVDVNTSAPPADEPIVSDGGGWPAEPAETSSLTTLSLAIASGNTDAFKALLAAGANVDTAGADGSTALATAAKSNDGAAATALLAAGASYPPPGMSTEELAGLAGPAVAAVLPDPTTVPDVPEDSATTSATASGSGDSKEGSGKGKGASEDGGSSSMLYIVGGVVVVAAVVGGLFAAGVLGGGGKKGKE